MFRVDPGHPELQLDRVLLHIHRTKTYKKLRFLRSLDSTKFSDWKSKSFTPNVSTTFDRWITDKKIRRKRSASRRKLRKAEKKISDRAKYAWDKKLVVNLTSVTIPDYAVAILSYGEGYIPCPRFDDLQYKLDGLNVANKIAWKAFFKEGVSKPDLPSKLLAKPITASCTVFSDTAIRTVKDDITGFVENLVPPKSQSNMNMFERQGYQWLLKATSNGTLAITKADKGGAIILTTPETIWELCLSKLQDCTQFTDLGVTDPSPNLQSKLLEAWKTGVTRGYISPSHAKTVVGLILKDNDDNDDQQRNVGDRCFTISTSDVVKPGIPYPYPLLKLHKLNEEQLAERVVPPIRLVTDLSKGITARSDKYLVSAWLGSLSRDYCKDSVKDTTEALKRLDTLDRCSSLVGEDSVSFSTDVVSLYDSLKHEVVLEALDDAISTCRPEWTPSFINWLKNLIIDGFEAAVLNFGQKWYRLARGIPTGAVCSVDLGNIAVYYVLKTLLYSVPERSRMLINVMRFIDDVTGQAHGPTEALLSMLESLRQEMIRTFSLDITFEAHSVRQPTQFLDFLYVFKASGLETDLYRKPTDANRFLYYSSFHPPHIYRGIVVSQFHRYRRNISNDDMLEVRLSELRQTFIESAYPPKMVDQTLESLRGTPRSLDYVDRSDSSFGENIPWIVTFGPGFREARAFSRKANQKLLSCNTWKSKPEAERPQVKVVARRAPSLKDKLFRRRAIALGCDFAPTLPCTPLTHQDEVQAALHAPYSVVSTGYRIMGN